MEEFFAAVACVPKSTAGLKKFLSNIKGAMQIKGAYGVLRLLCEAPELASKAIEQIADILATGKLGVDLITSGATVAGRRIGEFWEFKHVEDAFGAVTSAQIRKHLTSRVVAEIDELGRTIPIADQLRSAVSQIKLRFEIIAPNASAAAKEQLYRQVRDVLEQEYPQLLKAGFSFTRADIIMRAGDPLAAPAELVRLAVF